MARSVTFAASVSMARRVGFASASRVLNAARSGIGADSFNIAGETISSPVALR